MRFFLQVVSKLLPSISIAIGMSRCEPWRAAPLCGSTPYLCNVLPPLIRLGISMAARSRVSAGEMRRDVPKTPGILKVQGIGGDPRDAELITVIDDRGFATILEVPAADAGDVGGAGQ